jgi:hypothetical protein
MVQAFAAWGGVPRYWELARDASGTTPERVESLVLDPRGPLHREPDRLLVEELPPALEVRPVLDAIGGGAHRVSEIAARMGRPATSLSRALDRLVGLGLATREVPFGEPEQRGKRSLYRISEPFFRLWFRVVAPNRAQLVAANREARLALLARHWDGLLGSCWEDLVRAYVSRGAGAGSALDGAGPFGPARRWWRGAAPEWDVVSESLDRQQLLVGEAKWSARAVRRGQLERWAHSLLARPLPPLPGMESRRIVRCLFVPTPAAGAARAIDGVQVVTGSAILGIPG